MIRHLSLGIASSSDTAVGAISTAGRQLKSSFVLSTGRRKRKPDDESTPSETPATKRRATVSPDSVSADATSSSDRDVDPPLDAILVNSDIVGHHVNPRTSVIQPIYRRLLPDDIVRLKSGDEIIVVIPILDRVRGKGEQKDLLRIAYARRLQYRMAFEGIINYTLRGMHPGDRTSIVNATIRDCHTLMRGEKPYLEFTCRVKHYPEREHLSRPITDLRTIKYSWSQGAGINLSLCGYSTR
jgi:hypothetical protein